MTTEVMDSAETPEIIQEPPRVGAKTYSTFINFRGAFSVVIVVLVAAFFEKYGPRGLNGIYRFFGTHFGNMAVNPITGEAADKYPGSDSAITIVPLTLLGAMVGAWLSGLIIRTTAKIKARWEKMDIGDRVSLIFGVFIGLVVCVPIISIFNALSISNVYLPLLVIAITVGAASMTVYAFQSISEVLPWYRNRTATKRSGIKILDTNVIIDGRVYDIIRSGFLEGEIYVPKFVLEELQHIADHHDSLKRNRGRRGLEVLKNLQGNFPMEVGKYDRYAPDNKEQVDARLVRIAKAIGADIVTNDWNLNSVAKLQNVKILSLNELALTLRPNVLPGEKLELNIIREGNQHGQGIGYLEDGTMVVVENGREHLGETLDVTVSQVLQTERGKMIFAEVEVEDDPSRRRRRQ